MSITLPLYLRQLSGSAAGFAGFLSKTNFIENRMINDLRDLSTFEGMTAAYARNGKGQGLAQFVEDTIRDVHTSTAFDGHARDLSERDPDMRIPRLRALIPARPDPEDWARQIRDAFLEALNQPDTTRAAVETYLFGPLLSELQGDTDHRAAFTAMLRDDPDLVLRLVDHIDLFDDRPDMLGVLLRTGCRHFAARRHYERAYELAQLHVDRLGVHNNDIPTVLGDLWYAAFRTGRTDDAIRALDLWCARQPVFKRPICFKAMVLADSDPKAARALLEDAGAALGRAMPAGNVLYADMALAAGDTRLAEQAIRNAIYEHERMSPDTSVPRDYLIALHNITLAQGRPSRALDPVFAAQGTALKWDDRFGVDTITDKSAARPATAGRVAVVMTAYQAKDHIERAISGVLGQSHRDLELIVVDDGSTDGTDALCDSLAANDPRMRVLRMPRNMGTYAAKNHGIRDALTRRPNFVALCDADDVWLRHHLAAHLEKMAERPDAVCSISKWLRLRDDGHVECGPQGRYVEPCPHSTFFKRGAFKKAGLFDAVRFGADSEFLNRLKIHFGEHSIAEIDEILTLGRRHAASLTQSGAGAIGPGETSKQRQAYRTGWNEWHLALARQGQLPRLDPDPDATERVFPISDDMRP